jgi:serine/threonine-protein kinase
MSPEQVTAGHVDRRTDIFALAVVLWELVTGGRLFGTDADAGQIMYRVLSHEIRAPAEVDPRVPRALSEALMKALARNPAERYETALELRNALADHGVPHHEVVAQWAGELQSEELAQRARRWAEILEEQSDEFVLEASMPETAEPSAPETPPEPAPEPSAAVSRHQTLGAGAWTRQRTLFTPKSSGWVATGFIAIAALSVALYVLFRPAPTASSKTVNAASPPSVVASQESTKPKTRPPESPVESAAPDLAPVPANPVATAPPAQPSPQQTRPKPSRAPRATGNAAKAPQGKPRPPEPTPADSYDPLDRRH